jgi:4-hydroxybenzoate polyprenyltransferase
VSVEAIAGASRSGLLRSLIALARPKDWLKQVFVLMPLPFALASGARFDAVALFMGLAAMCLVSSAVYALNDVLDAERDRASSRTAHRPIAAGRISARTGLLAAGTWLVLSLALAGLSGHPAAALVIAGYALLNVAYSLGAKHVPLIDVCAISAGFVLRVVLGCVLVGVAPSNWLLLCSSALALFLALGKRRGELAQGLTVGQRPSLAGYSGAYLDQAMGILAAVTIVAYALYSIEAPLLVPGREFASLPFAVFGVLEYLRLVQVRGEGSSTVELLLRSPGMLFAGVGWTLASLWSVGSSRLLP